MFFNRALFILLAGLSVILGSQISAAKDYPIGTVFNDVIEYDFNAGRYKVPLPPGNWKLITKIISRTEPDNTTMVRSYFIRHDQRLVTGLLRVVVPREMIASHWVISNTCSEKRKRRSWYFDEDTYEKHEDCTVVYPLRGFRRTSKNLQETFTYIERMNLVIPNTWILSRFALTDKEDYLQISYALPQENYGFPREQKYSNTKSPWSINNIDSFPKKKAFMEKVRVWAKSWKGLIDKGFKNELRRDEVLAHPKIDGSFNRMHPKTPAASPNSPSTPTKILSGSAEDRLKQAKRLFDGGLISKSQYDAKRAEILKGL